MEFRLLGDLQVWHGGGQLDLGGQRQRCVLAVLLLNADHVVAMDRIVSDAWGLEAPPTARRLVTAYVSRLRRIVEVRGEVELTSRAPGYLLTARPDLIDLHRFRELIRRARVDRDAEPAAAVAGLREALNLWRGTPLADLDSQVLRERGAALEAVRLDALEELAELELAGGRPREAVTLLREPHAEHPERERLAALLIQSLYRAGEPSQAAVVALRAVRAVQAMGLRAGPLVLRAQQEVLSGRVPPAHDPGTGPRRQLPPAVAYFTGRSDELALLARLARAAADATVAGSAVVAVIEGFGGLGKTALALCAAHRAARLFPDGQLFVDLRAHTPGAEPLTPMDAMHRLLRALGVPPQFIPDDPADRSAYLRDRLSGTRTLLVLDNAADATQVRPLIPASERCLVLVTTRSDMTGLDGTATLPLQTMAAVESVALLRAVAGPERPSLSEVTLTEVAELCGHIPLAVRLAAARLRRRRSLTAEALAAELGDEHRRLAGLADGERSLTAAFDLSYHRLPPAGRVLFRRLALIPGADFDAHVAAALTEEDAESCGALLESFLDHHLLIQHTAGRYRFHDMIRLYARALGRGDGAAEAALDRVLAYYGYTARLADRRLSRRPAGEADPPGDRPRSVPVLDSRPAGEAWMHAEAGNCLAAAELAAARRQPGHVIALADALHWYLRTFGPWSRALALHQEAVEAARSLGDRRQRAGALRNLGEIRYLTGDFPAARAALDEALRLSRTLGDRRGRADTGIVLGELLQRAADYEQASAELQQALDLLRDADDPGSRARALNLLGALRRLTGNLPAAERLLREALALHRSIDNPQGQASALTNLGAVLQQTGELPRAAEHYTAAVDLFRSVGDQRGQAIALGNLSTLLRETGDYTGARAAVETCLDLRDVLGDKMGRANDLVNLGAILQETNDNERAVTVLNDALALHRELGNPEGIAFCLDTLGLVHRQRGDHAAALRYLDRAAAFEAIDEKAGLIGAIKSSADVDTEIGEFETAATLYRRAVGLAHEVGMPRLEAQALEGLAENALRRGDREAAVAHLRACREIYARLGLPDAERVGHRIDSLSEEGP